MIFYSQELTVASCCGSIGCSPIEILVVQRVYKYIVKDKNLPDYKLLKQARNIGCKVQKTNKSKILLAS